MASRVLLCNICRHRGGGTGTCDAYPTGIPHGILRGMDDHREPLPGDHGIQFEADEGIDPEVLRLYCLPYDTRRRQLEAEAAARDETP